MTKIKQPKIRFKGHINDWEERKLEDISKIFIGLVTTMTENYRNEGTLLIRNSDIKDNRFEFSSKPIFLEESFAEKNKNRRFKLGDVITVHTGDIGTSAVITENEEGAIGFATINTRPNKNILNSQFLSTYFNTEKHKQYAIKMSTGDGRSNYNLKDFTKLVISVPVINEQNKIGEFFKTLDETITLHQQKLEVTKQFKQTMLKKMFPKNGETTPEIRFKGFTEDWEKYKVNEIFKVTRGQVLATTEINEEQSETMPYPVYSSQTKNDGIMGYYKDYLFDTAITWTTDGANAGTVNYRSGKFYSTNVNGVLLSEEGYANKAIAEILNREAWKWVSHVGNPKLMNNVMGNIVIYIPPSFEEQNILSDFFLQLDDTISLHQQKLKILKEMKKTMLQKMFI